MLRNILRCASVVLVLSAGYVRADERISLAEDNSLFALDMYSQLSSTEGNMLFSPFSLSSALTMAYEGAGGQTAAEMRKVLHIPEDKAFLHEQWRHMSKILAGSRADQPYELNIANALWVEKTYPLNENYAKVIADVYSGVLYSQDFAEDSETSRLFINNWVSEKTKTRIQELLPPDSIDELTRIVITNAVYFKGEWKDEFKKSRTQKSPFFMIPGKPVQVDMMNSGKERRFNYFENDDVQIVSLVYKGDNLSMSVILPRKNDIKSLEKVLNAATIKQWQSQMYLEEVDVYLPKFKFGFFSDMGEILATFGMKRAFDAAQADFAGMMEEGTERKEKLYIGGVFHKAWIAVDEKATEAAAATAVMMGITNALVNDEPKVFHADHPFIFIIQERLTGQVLFMGRVSDPTKE